MSWKPDIDRSVSKISGNASDHAKELVADPTLYLRAGTGFADAVAARLVVTDVSLLPAADESARPTCRVTCELTVSDDMLNGAATLHGGCAAFLIDLCSTLVLVAHADRFRPGVSQSLSTVYHSPALPGDRLRIVNTTIAAGARSMSARSEIWDTTHHRLVASGVHIKMDPSPSPKSTSKDVKAVSKL